MGPDGVHNMMSSLDAVCDYNTVEKKAHQLQVQLIQPSLIMCVDVASRMKRIRDVACHVIDSVIDPTSNDFLQ